jgi:hypothetical protein
MMQFILERKKLPPSVVKRNRIINWVMTALNIGIPFMSAFSYFIVKLIQKYYCPYYYEIPCPAYDHWNNFQVDTRFMISGVEVVSGIFLAIGVLKIRALIKSGKNSDIDVKQLLSHVVTFSFFLVANTVSYGYYANYKWGRNHLTTQSLNKYDKATIACNAFSFVAQLVQVWILNHFSAAENHLNEALAPTEDAPELIDTAQ